MDNAELEHNKIRRELDNAELEHNKIKRTEVDNAELEYSNEMEDQLEEDERDETELLQKKSDSQLLLECCYSVHRIIYKELYEYTLNPYGSMSRITKKIIDSVNDSFKQLKLDVEQQDQRAKDRTKTQALELLLDQKYPEELRLEMLRKYDSSDFDGVLESAASCDMPLRERPNAGKKGPSDPLVVFNETYEHIGWDKFLENAEK